MLIRSLFIAMLFLFCGIRELSAQTLVGDGVTDNTPIWNALVANVCASNDREVQIGKGTFRFASPMAGIPCSLHVQGEGWGISVIQCDFSSNTAACYYVIGGMDPYGGGILRDVSIFVTSGNTIAFALEVQAHLETDPTISSHNPHGFMADHVSIGRSADGSPPFTGTWLYGIYLDGSANANPPAGVAPFIRTTHIRDVFINSYATAAAFAYYASGSRWINVDCPMPTGSNILGQFDHGSTYVAGTCPYLNIGN